MRSKTAANRQEENLAGLYYEDFEVGKEFEHELSRTVTEHDNISFSLMTMNPQPLHVDNHFSAQTEWGKPLFNSLYTLAIMIGMSVQDTTPGATIGNLGMSDVRFPKPVFAGDTLRGRTRILSKRESASRPDAGIDEAERAGVAMWVVPMVRQFLVFARSQGDGPRDYGNIIRHFEQWAGVTFGAEPENGKVA